MPAYHLHVLRFKEGSGPQRIKICSELRKNGIFAQVHYIPVYLQPWYRKEYGYQAGKCLEAETVYSNCLSIPLYPSMSEAEIEKVIHIIKDLAK